MDRHRRETGQREFTGTVKLPDGSTTDVRLLAHFWEDETGFRTFTFEPLDEAAEQALDSMERLTISLDFDDD